MRRPRYKRGRQAAGATCHASRFADRPGGLRPRRLVLSKAADRGFAPAMNNLGSMYGQRPIRFGAACGSFAPLAPAIHSAPSTRPCWSGTGSGPIPPRREGGVSGMARTSIRKSVQPGKASQLTRRAVFLASSSIVERIGASHPRPFCCLKSFPENVMMSPTPAERGGVRECVWHVQSY